MGGVADGAQTLGDRLALAGEAPVLVARCCDILRALSYTRCPLWGRPGPRCAGSPLALGRCSCTCLRVSSAFAAALAAARCLVASGAATAFRRSCGPWKRAGE